MDPEFSKGGHAQGRSTQNCLTKNERGGGVRVLCFTPTNRRVVQPVTWRDCADGAYPISASSVNFSTWNHLRSLHLHLHYIYSACSQRFPGASPSQYCVLQNPVKVCVYKYVLKFSLNCIKSVMNVLIHVAYSKAEGLRFGKWWETTKPEWKSIAPCTVVWYTSEHKDAESMLL